MSLPILPAHHATSDADLVRLFARTEKIRSQQLGDCEQLDAGLAVTSEELESIPEANRLLEASIPPGHLPQSVFAEVETWFASRGLSCREVMLDPSADASRTQPLADHLKSQGWGDRGRSVYVRKPLSIRPVRTPPEWMVLPTRSALKHARQLWATLDGTDDDRRRDARERHIDDPHSDSLLVLEAGRAIGQVTVLAVGDLGRIDDFVVESGARGRGVGTLLLSRALEVAARSNFRHMFIGVGDELPAMPTSKSNGLTRLLERIGFQKVGHLQAFGRPVVEKRPSEPLDT